MEDGYYGALRLTGQGAEHHNICRTTWSHKFKVQRTAINQMKIELSGYINY
jgi:hypothetical protein